MEQKKLSCAQVKEKLKDLLQGSLAPASRGRVKAHLLLCEDCLNTWGEYIDLAIAGGDIAVPLREPFPLKSWWEKVKETYQLMFDTLRQAPAAVRPPIEELLKEKLSLLNKYREKPEAELLRQHMYTDPLFSLVALGTTEKELTTRPFFYTARREKPAGLKWLNLKEAQEYLVTIYHQDKEMIYKVPSSKEKWVNFKWPVPLTREGTIWQVQPVIAGKPDPAKSIAGKFWLASEEDIARVKKLEECSKKLQDKVTSVIVLSAIYQQAGLYDEAIRILTEMIESSPGQPETIPLRNALGNIYLEIQGKILSEEIRLLNRRADIVSEMGKEQLKLIYCLLLGNYHRYEHNECESCKECGLV